MTGPERDGPDPRRGLLRALLDLFGDPQGLVQNTVTNVAATLVIAAMTLLGAYALRNLELAIGVLALAVATAAAVLVWRRRRRDPLDEDPGPPLPGGPLLPPDIVDFVGRREALAEVLDVRDAPAVAVVGPREAGTSAFVLHAAHRLADRFPDGQLYLDVRGARPARRPDPARVLRETLRHLGLSEPRTGREDDLDAVARALHAWLAEHRVLLVLDNVDDPELVARLLPRTPDCFALIAGSYRLAELAGARVVALPELTDAEGVELLAVTGGEHCAEDPVRAADLVRRVNRRPLAIRLLGRRMREHDWRPADVLAAATTDLGPLSGLLAVSYRHLGRVAGRVFRLLSVVPATEVDVSAVAALVGISVERAAVALDELVRTGLLESAAPGRYRLRQHLHDAGAVLLQPAEPVRRRRRARLRLARHCALAAQEHADALLAPAGAEPDPLAVPHRTPEEPPDPGPAQARAWFRREHELLFQLVVGWSGEPGRTGASRSEQRWLYRLAVALCVWYADQRRPGDWAEVCAAVLGMPLARRDRWMASWAYNERGIIHRLRARHEEAARDLVLAQRLRRRRRRGRAQVSTNLGLVLINQGRYAEALSQLEEARRLRSRRDRRGQARTDLALGIAYWRCGQPEVAVQLLTDAENAFRDLPDRRGLAAALNNLGLVLAGQGELRGAAERWGLARELYRATGDRNGELRVTVNESAAALAAGDPDLDAVATALTDVVERTASGKAGITAGLAQLLQGDVAHRQGRPAAGHWAAAREILAGLHAPEAVEAERRLATYHQPATDLAS